MFFRTWGGRDTHVDNGQLFTDEAVKTLASTIGEILLYIAASHKNIYLDFSPFSRSVYVIDIYTSK